jgi:hypothetical protein
MLAASSSPSATPPAGTDHAIVVGIGRYPYLDPLSGSKNDARAFHQWLTTASAAGGGGVPPGNARLILASQLAQLPFDPGMDPPTIYELDKEFRRLHTIAEQNSAAGRGLRVGRRLYLFSPATAAPRGSRRPPCSWPTPPAGWCTT